MLYFLYGDGAPLQIKFEETLKELKEKNYGIDERYYDFSQNESEKFLEDVAQNSIFGDIELMVVKRFEALKHKEKFIKTLEVFNLATKEIVIVYEEFFNEYGKREDEADLTSQKSKKKLIESFEKLGEIHCKRKENERKSAIFYVTRNLNIEEKQAEKLLEIIGEEFYKVKNEVEKIKIFLGEEEYSLEKIKNIISKTEEFNLKTSIEEMLKKKETNKLIVTLEEEKQYYSFLSIIYEEILTLLKIKLVLESGEIDSRINYNQFKESYPKFNKHFKNYRKNQPLHPYQVFLKIEVAKNYEVNFLKKRLNEIPEIEFLGKSGSVPETISVIEYILKFFSEN
ncbi:MAG: hypothetical protein ACRC0V_08215 [Fusobacteriaceae bacterium]